MYCSILLLLIILLEAVSSAHASQHNKVLEVPLYTYHTHPPFITSPGKGLSYDLANYLTRKSADRFRFVVKPMSRPRVNKMLAEADIGIIPWVNPAWFRDTSEEKYRWCSAILMNDANALISRRDKKVNYTGPESLDGLTFGGVRAHVYAGLDDYIAETKRLRRVDAENHVDNFRKLVKRRIDVTIMPRSGADYLIKREKLEEYTYISPTPHSKYARRLIIIGDSRDLLQIIEGVTGEMSHDPVWLKEVERYR